jgi:hypothetical protein
VYKISISMYKVHQRELVVSYYSILGEISLFNTRECILSFWGTLLDFHPKCHTYLLKGKVAIANIIIKQI